LEQIVHKALSWKNPTEKGAGGLAQGVSPEFKPQYHKKVVLKKKPNKPNSCNLAEIFCQC
jgi:hypothetical protein